MTAPLVRILLVDDHQVLRMGLRALLQTVPHFSVVGEAGSAAEGLAEVERLAPHVVVMDIRLPDGSGVEACRAIRLRYPETQVVIFSAYVDSDLIVRSVQAGASGYVLKGTDSAWLIRAIESVARNEGLFDPPSTVFVLEWVRGAGGAIPEPAPSGLSRQERSILALIAGGKTNREIAGALSLSEYTVKWHVTEIFRKLGVRRRAEAVAMVARQPWGVRQASTAD